MAGPAWLLIVDDDEMLSGLLARLVRRGPGTEQLHVETASTPEGALRTVDERCDHPLVVLSDYDLKTVLNGIQLLGLVRERCPATRRILYSGHAREHIEPRLTPDVDAFYEKPDRLADLLNPVLAHVRSVLERGRSTA